jgi:hypothetical protein
MRIFRLLVRAHWLSARDAWQWEEQDLELAVRGRKAFTNVLQRFFREAQSGWRLVHGCMTEKSEKATGKHRECEPMRGFVSAESRKKKRRADKRTKQDRKSKKSKNNKKSRTKKNKPKRAEQKSKKGQRKETAFAQPLSTQYRFRTPPTGCHRWVMIRMLCLCSAWHQSAGLFPDALAKRAGSCLPTASRQDPWRSATCQ